MPLFHPLEDVPLQVPLGPVLSKHHEEVNASVVRKSGKVKGSLHLILQFEPTPGSQPQAAAPSANNTELVRARGPYGSCSCSPYGSSSRPAPSRELLQGWRACPHARSARKKPPMGRDQLPQGSSTHTLTYPAEYHAPQPVLQLTSLKVEP